MPGSSSLKTATVTKIDPVWDRLQVEAEEAARNEPVLASFIYEAVLQQPSLAEAVASRVAQRLTGGEISVKVLAMTFTELVDQHPELNAIFQADLIAVRDRDPACYRFIEPLLYFKGFHALQCYRFAHLLYSAGRRDMAYFLQSQASRMFSIDIHPAAKVGKGIFFDHAHSLVIGETAVIGDDVSILHSVTLGGTGKDSGDRHPKIDDGVLIGAGAKVLGNIRIGHCSRIAAGSVVLEDIPPKTTVAGVPAKVIGEAGCSKPSRTMNQLLQSYEALDPGQ